MWRPVAFALLHVPAHGPASVIVIICTSLTRIAHESPHGIRLRSDSTWMVATCKFKSPSQLPHWSKPIILSMSFSRHEYRMDVVDMNSDWSVSINLQSLRLPGCQSWARYLFCKCECCYYYYYVFIIDVFVVLMTNLVICSSELWTNTTSVDDDH